MKTVAILLTLSAMLTGVPGDAAWLSHDGGPDGASYHFRTETGEPSGGLRSFEMETGSGRLAVRIEDAEEYGRITMTHEESGSTAIATYGPAGPEGVWDAHLAFPQLEADFYFKSRTDVPQARLAADNSPDCEEVEASAIVRAVRDARSRLDRDVASFTRPPAHLAGTAGVVALADDLLALGGCATEQRADAGACYYDSRNFNQCYACCDTESNAVGAVCGGGVLLGCTNPWCRKLGTLVCGVAIALSHGTCTSHNCGGLPGNPACTAPKPPCPGLCMEFCGPGWSSTCGECEGDRECCS